MTHRELCQIGASWLLNQSSCHFRCQYVCVEIVTIANEKPDVFGLMGGANTILLEVKVNRSDFFADLKKSHRETGRGIGSERYYLCPDGIIKEKELPENWGLLYYRDSDVTIIKQAKPQEKDSKSEMEIMYSLIRRIIPRRQVLDFRKTSENNE